MTTTRKLATGVAAAALAFAVMSAAAHAQETTGGINGRLQDGPGKPVAGAQVTVVYAPTNQTFTAVTGPSGEFSIRQLPPGGPYRVVTKDAAHPERSTDVPNIGVGSPYELAIDYGAAEPAATEVVVTGQRSAVRQVQTGPRSTFTAVDIETLPSFTRDLRDVARLNPFVQVNGVSLSIAGNNNRYNAVYVDGVRESDDFGLNANGYPTQRSPISTELVQSFNVEVAPYDVQYGAFQGGVLNVATKSGGNDFHGSAYYEYDSRQLGAGEEIRDRPAIINFKDKNYGFTLSGPIWRDHMFFSFGYENYEGLSSPSYGPADATGVANNVQGITSAQVQQVQQILQSVYGYDAGATGYSAPVTSEKYFGKFTWNVTDKHRFVFEVQNDDDVQFNTFNSSTTLALGSTPYNFNQTLESYSGYLYSNWTPNLSTEISYTHRDTNGITQNLGAPFPNFQIFLNGTASGQSIRVGQDISRQANALITTDELFRAKANYSLGAHTLTVGYERDSLTVFNLFVQNAIGNYQFTSIANLQNRTASSLTYANAASNNANDAAANWGDTINTGYVQDEWRPLSNLTLRGGVRLEWYEQSDRPKANTLFQQLYGFSNAQNLDGKVLVQPRFGFNYRPVSNLLINGGLGRFSGGSPNVWISNNFSNSGNLIGSVNCSTTNAPAATCGNALTTVQGLTVNPTVLAANTASASLGTGIVNALDPKFEPPSVWKASVAAVYTANFADWSWAGAAGRYLGNDWRLHGDLFYQVTEKGVRWIDLQTINQVIGTAPDGRPIFNVNRSVSRPNTYDILLTNTNKGHGLVYAIGLGKTFDWGLDFDVTYTHQNVKEYTAANSSVALSSYRFTAFSDPNNLQLATSDYNTRDSIKVNLGIERKFFGDFATRFRLYGTRRSGSPYSFTFTGASNVQANQNDAFGLANNVGGTGNNELFYVPRTDASGAVTLTSDPKVSYAAGFDIAQFNAFLQASGLTRYAGQISPRNQFTTRDVTQVDLSFVQEIPAFVTRRAKGEFYLDLFNVGNLINNGWGISDTYGNFYNINVTPTILSCAAAGVTGCAAGQVNQYRYTPINANTPTGFGRAATISTGGQPPVSLWALKLGVRLKF